MPTLLQETSVQIKEAGAPVAPQQEAEDPSHSLPDGTCCPSCAFHWECSFCYASRCSCSGVTPKDSLKPGWNSPACQGETWHNLCSRGSVQREDFAFWDICQTLTSQHSLHLTSLLSPHLNHSQESQFQDKAL